MWTFNTGEKGPLEATPLVVDGTLYFSGLSNTAWAIDGRTGREIWRYERKLPAVAGGLRLCCNASNRGLAIHGDRLFMATLDAHLVALDRRTGAVLFDVAMGEVSRGYSASAAPLVIRDKVIVGIPGGEFVSRGFLDAYDVSTGERAWRFWTVPRPGEPGSETWPAEGPVGGGGATWLTGTYDADLNLLYWGTGNPTPPFDGSAGTATTSTRTRSLRSIRTLVPFAGTINSRRMTRTIGTQIRFRCWPISSWADVSARS